METPQTIPDQPVENVKTAWWRQHKNDPHILQCMRDARKKYYYKNQEAEKARSRARYYAMKALTAPPPPEPTY